MNKFILDLWAGRDDSVVQAWVQTLRSHVKRQMWRYTPVIPALGVGAGGSPKLTGHSRFNKRADDKSKGSAKMAQ